MRALTIGQVARQAGVGVETVRFYERQGLLDAPPRRASGYRQYAPEMVARLQFIRRAKELGFALKEIRELLSLRVAPETTCGDIKQQAEAKMADIDAKLRDLQRMKMALAQLVDACSGSGPTSQCPILDALESHEAAVSTSPHPKHTAATGESEEARAAGIGRAQTARTHQKLFTSA
ncbi:MAG: MerR family DNA-binding protein [Acidobacteria bacterium]|nr:MerR family DNA-binding protein [Acidobacteriota bacterium]